MICQPKNRCNRRENQRRPKSHMIGLILVTHGKLAEGFIHIDEGHTTIVGQQNGERGQNEYGEGGKRDIAFARPTRLQLHYIAEQFGDRHIMRAPQWPQSEDECRQ